MKGGRISFSALKSVCAGGPVGATLLYMFAATHEERVEAVQQAIDYACRELETNRHMKQKRSEDQLTVEICSMLRMAGIQAAHDEQICGHCDIVIRGKDSFLWLAEAKKHDAYEWLNKGFLQLSTRYSSGTPGQDNGDILIYCFAQDAAAMLAKWRQELQDRNEGVTANNSNWGSPLAFCSTHKHEASGLNFTTRHKAVVLYWNPKV